VVHSSRTLSSSPPLEIAASLSKSSRDTSRESAHMAAPRTIGASCASKASMRGTSVGSRLLPAAISTLRQEARDTAPLDGRSRKAFAEGGIVESEQIGEARSLCLGADGNLLIV
jgi:hypothetical protein